MKKQIMMITVLFVALGSVSAQHDHSSHGQKEGSKMDHSMHKGMKMKDGQMTREVSDDFKEQLTEVYNKSLELTGSFVAGELENASNNSSLVKAALGKVDMSLLKSSEAHMDWMMNLKEMNTALDQIATSTDIKAQRTAYASFNQALYKSMKAFGTTAGTVYYQHCPMARNGEGAFWLSAEKDIKNPYYGEAMLSCGENREVIE